VLVAIAVVAPSCGGGDDSDDPEPPARPTTAQPPPPADQPPPGHPFAKLPKPRYLDQDPPACCPRLLGGWQQPRLAAPGEEVTATLSSPGPDPDDPPRVEVHSDVVLRITHVTAAGEPIRVVRERHVRAEAIQEIHRPLFTTRLPDTAPALYAFELVLQPSRGPHERYVDYAYVPPQRAAVGLTLDRTTAQPGETLQLTVENRGPSQLIYGVDYRLERWTGDWQWLNRDEAFIAIAKGVLPGRRERAEIRLPSGLEPGRYRIVKSFTAPSARQELEASVEFTVS
jgi:hypothetical protein